MRCKLGDIAIILDESQVGADHAGQQCTVVEYIPPRRPFRSGDYIVIAEDPAWRVLCRDGTTGYYVDSRLMPLRDPDADVSETQDRTVTA